MSEPQQEALDAGNYEIIRTRLLAQGKTLRTKAEGLNAQRKELFGGNELSVVATSRVRTDNNCVPRDIISVRNHLLMGYTVGFGLKQDTSIEDIFGLHDFEHAEDQGEAKRKKRIDAAQSERVD